MKQKLLIIVGIVAVLGIAAASLQLLRGDRHTETVCAHKTGESHEVMIMNGSVEPAVTIAKVCDSVTITNHDAKAREIAFGAMDHHISYDGVSEKVLNRDQSLTVTLTMPGEFHFHDHLQEEVGGSLTVRK